MRDTRDQMLMRMAHVAADRGTCNRLKVGAVLALEARPISIGYNGSAPGRPHCGPDCNMSSPCTLTVHAEHNAIRWATEHSLSTIGATIYITDSPCLDCAGRILKAGITRVVYDREYRITDALDLLKRLGVEVVRCQI
jgi:dCMP deaminase